MMGLIFAFMGFIFVIAVFKIISLAQENKNAPTVQKTKFKIYESRDNIRNTVKYEVHQMSNKDKPAYRIFTTDNLKEAKAVCERCNLYGDIYVNKPLNDMEILQNIN